MTSLVAALLVFTVCVTARKLEDKFHTRISEDGDVVFVRQTDKAANEKRLSDCECTCRRKWSEEWTCCECAWTDSLCFPGAASVHLISGDTISMSTLTVGDRVLSGSGGFSEVRAFLERSPNVYGRYLSLRTATGQEIRIAGRHIIFGSSTNNTNIMETKYSKDVKIGDFLLTSDQIVPDRVVEITEHVMEGAYVPLTSDGTIMVDGVLASCYSSIDHNLGHIALTPFRWYPWLLGYDTMQEGKSTIVQWLKNLGHVILPSSMNAGMNFRDVMNEAAAAHSEL